MNPEEHHLLLSFTEPSMFQKSIRVLKAWWGPKTNNNNLYNRKGQQCINDNLILILYFLNYTAKIKKKNKKTHANQLRTINC